MTLGLMSRGYLGAGSSGDGLAPVVANVTPTPGTPVYPDTALEFDVTDADGFIVIIPMIILDPYKVPEPTAHGIFDADFAFEGLYKDGSSRTAITNGYHYKIKRRNGWYAAPRLLIWAVDKSGAIWIGP